MAIPGIPSNFNVQTANQQNFLSWGIQAGATSYSVLRSTDGISYTLLATPTDIFYLDTAVTVGTLYYYKIAAASTDPVLASATLTFTGQPTAAETFSVANVTFTAVASGATGNQFNIGGTVALTIANLVAAVNASSSLTRIVTAEATSATVVTFSAFETGVEGNGLQLTEALSNVTAVTFAGGVAGVLSPYTQPQSVVPVPAGEASLGSIRLQAQQRADRVNSQFVTLIEWNQMINMAMFELYDLLVTAYGEEYFAAPALVFNTNGTDQFYDLPNGTNYSGALPFYKLLGVDLGLNTSAQPNNGWVTVGKFNLIDRNAYYYPNTNSSQYGLFNMRYRLFGNKIEFIPTPSASQPMRLWYIPRMTMLLKDTDITTNGISGWLQYVIVRAAKYALNKEESDTSSLDQELLFLKNRIEGTAMNRDAGQPDKISDTRGAVGWNGGGGGNSGMWGAGW